jgi:hypothetical protein
MLRLLPTVPYISLFAVRQKERSFTKGKTLTASLGDEQFRDMRSTVRDQAIQ